MVDLERSTQLTSGPELRDVAANRSGYEPKAGLHYKATDTGAEFIGDGNRWNKIKSTGANPSFRSLETEEANNRPQVYGGDDSTTDVQAKLDNLSSIYGGPLEADPEEYDLSQTLTLRNRERLWGAGIESTRFVLADGVDSSAIEYTDESAQDSFFGEVRDLRIDGNKANNASGHGYYIHKVNGNNANDSHVSRIIVFDAAGSGLQADFVWGLHVDHSLFEDCANAGISIAGGSQFYLSDIFSAYNGGAGVSVSARFGRVIGVTSRANAQYGFTDNGGENLYIGNIANQNEAHGYYLRQPNTTLAGCTAYRNGVGNASQYGALLSADNITVLGGYFYDDPDSTVAYEQEGGISVGGAGCRLLGPTCNDNNVGIKISGNATKAIAPKCENSHDYGITVDANDTQIAFAEATTSGVDDIYIYSGSADTNLVHCNFGSINDNGTRTRWNGVIGGGPLGGVDLGTTTGQHVGDEAMANGTTGTAYLHARWTGTGWQQSDGSAVI